MSLFARLRTDLTGLVRSPRGRTPRGTAEMSVVVVVTSLVAGVLFGNGLTRTTVDLTDGLTWLADDPSGDVIQVNPATGRPEYRYDVAGRNQNLEITQYDGRMFVVNHSTGQLTSFDLSTLLASGQRQVPSGTALSVLHHGDEVFLVDTHEGTIAGIDPVTTDPLGELWLARAGLLGATIDGEGRLWALDSDGVVTELRWSATEQRFFEEDTRPIEHLGPNSVIVGHERGATVFGPDEGVVVQVGTGHDLIADEPELSGRLAAPSSTPSTLVPVSSPETGRVFIVSGDRVWVSDVRPAHCAHPDRPEAFESVIYVPCPGDDRVLRLTPEGSRAASDIPTTPGGVPELVVDDDNLMINVQGAHEGLLVNGDGSVHPVVRYDDSVPPTEVSTTDNPPEQPAIEDIIDTADEDNGDAPVTPPPSSDPSDCERHRHDGCPSGTPGGGSGGGDDGSGDHGHHGGGGGGSSDPSGDPSTTPDPITAPNSVTATALPDGSVQVTWAYNGTAPDRFVVAEVGAGTLATVGGSNRQAVVSVDPGPAHQFTVTAEKVGDKSQTSAPSAGVATSGRPSAPTGVHGVATGSAANDSVAVSIAWSPAADSGSPITGYTVSATDNTGTHTVTTTTTSASYTTSCGDGQPFCDPGTVNVTVTAHNANGDGPAASGSISFSGPFASDLPTAGADLVTGHVNSVAAPGEWPMTTDLSLNPPADWASFNGTCSFSHNGSGTTFPCGAAALTVDNGTDGAQSITFTATNRRGSVSSRTYTWTAPLKPCPKMGCP